jgi:DNA-directed RNA polymerase subunit RPC12/RpoP
MRKVCDECSAELKDSADLAIHLNENHKKWYCASCKKEFDKEMELRNHVKNIHGIDF